ncbi:unnamed protein product [Scytosiphon promiscuus]
MMDGRASSVGAGSDAFAPAAGDVADYLAKEVLKLTMRSAAELEAVLTEVGTHDADGARMRVVNEMLAGVKTACEACVRQEKEERDGILANIQQAKVGIIDLSRKLGIPTPANGESMEAFFYCNQVMDTLFDRLVNLETTLDSLRTQERDRSRAVEAILREMETINENMDRKPEDGESEEDGGPEWEGKLGWELSEERLEKLRGRLAALRVLKFERATEMVGLVVDCQKLFRELGPPVTNPLQNKMLMSLDPSSPVDKPSLRTEAQTQTSVGLSVFNVDRLKKLREDMREDRELHTETKKQHRLQIGSLWEKLSVPERHRQEHLAKTKGITHSDMDELESELARLRKLKAEKLTDMLKTAREDVAELLEVVGAKAEEVLGGSARDLHVPPDQWTEDLLEGHEQFVKDLRAMGRRAAPIVEKVKKREELVQKREHADSFKVDYRARGGSGVLSQAKVIDGINKELKKLPNLTTLLRKELGAWQNEEGFPFRYNGREYLKSIEESDMHTGSMAFGSSVSASPSLHRQASNRSGNGSSGGAGSLIGSPSPRTKGGAGSGWGSGPLNFSTPGGRTGMGRTGSASSNSSAVSAGGGPMSLPSTPQKEARNPLLMKSFTPSPTFKGSRPARVPSAFASTGGSHRLPPPPLPARPVSMERSSSALSKLQSSPDLIKGLGAGGAGAAGAGGAMPPPLPDRPSNAAFEKADLHAIRESNASSLRSSASASDVLSGGRRTETTSSR